MRSLTVAALLVARVVAARPVVPAEALDRLTHYQVITFTDPAAGGLRRGKAIGLFDATPDEVFRVATDYEHLAEFAPRITSAKVLDRQGDRAVVALTTVLPWPVSKAWVNCEFAMERVGRDIYRIRFAARAGSLKRYEGSIYIEPWQQWRGGGTSAVTYELLVEPSDHTPRRFVNARVESVASKWVHFLRQRINQLRAAGRLHPAAPPDPDFASTLAGPKRPLQVGNVARAPR